MIIIININIAKL